MSNNSQHTLSHIARKTLNFDTSEVLAGSFKAVLLDPYPTKQLRAGLHALFLSLLFDASFKCRFAAYLFRALGNSVATDKLNVTVR
jgi:hypothetical protein